MKHILKHKGKLYEIDEVVEDFDACSINVTFYEVKKTTSGLYNRKNRLYLTSEGAGSMAVITTSIIEYLEEQRETPRECS